MKSKLLIKSFAILVITSFIAQDISWAAPMDSIANPGIIPLKAISDDPTRFEAPLDYVVMKEVHKGNNGTFIIHIQDAHSNFSGQENLANALSQIIKRYGVELVLVEGGDTNGSLSPLKQLALPDVVKRAAKSLLLESQITGEEYLSLVSDLPMKISGIEDMDLYYKSLRNYEKLAGQRQEILDYLKLIQNALTKLKTKLYPDTLKNYEALRAKHSGSDGFEALFKADRKSVV